MATTAKDLSALVPRHASRLGILWRSTVGKKALMAVTGVLLFLYVIAHMLGNLQLFVGPAAINGYARLLRVSPPLLFTARLVLLVAVLVHVLAGVQLWFRARQARPVGYATYRPESSSLASRTMIWSGLLILAFVVYHVLDLTLGVVHPDFREGEVFHNVLVRFGQVSGVIIYLVAMTALGFHLWHGVYSMFQSLGLSSRRVLHPIRRFAAGAAVVLALGFASIPLAVILGLVGSP
ncbi:MAG TPA: succinate dehydrogenase cytochrome b subunit [Anaeromyxobacter sp.]|nr:succinate dehydrogenase cytochrome b subunit [Anaeromyxobacter sp.]